MQCFKWKTVMVEGHEWLLCSQRAGLKNITKRTDLLGAIRSHPVFIDCNNVYHVSDVTVNTGSKVISHFCAYSKVISVKCNKGAAEIVSGHKYNYQCFQNGPRVFALTLLFWNIGHNI